MRIGLAVLTAAFVLLYAGSASVLANVSDPGAPRYTNSMFGEFVTPTVSPGRTVDFAFNLTNPYPEPMTHIVLTVGVYEYATQDMAVEVNSSFKHPPLIEGLAPQQNLTVADMPAGNSTRLELPISTLKDTPHGSYFSQSTYFVRFRLTFSFEGSSTLVVLQSKGFFTEAQWSQLVSFTSGQPIVDTGYLKTLGVDGLIPDSSFGIKVPIPSWPLAVLIVACVFVSLMALYYFVLDNPGKYPRLEKRAYYLRGKLSELRGQPKNRP